MKVQIYIDRLVLDRGSVPSHEQSLLKGTVEQELARLIREHGAPDGVISPGDFRRLGGGTIRPAPGSGPSELGRRIAEAVYRSFSP